MDEFGFKDWLKSCGIKEKVASDYLSRLKRLMRELCIDLDREYKKDKLYSVISAFNSTKNDRKMQNQSEINLTIKEYYFGTYKLALNKYRKYKQLLAEAKS